MEEKPTYEALEQRVLELEEELRAAGKGDEKYRILFEKSNDAILIIENGKFIDCNQSTLEMLGYTDKSQLLKTHPSDLSPEYQPDGKDSFAKAKEMMDLALKNGSHLFEWDHVRATGEIFPVEVLLTTIPYQNGNPIIHTVWRDITHRKQIEDALQKEKTTLLTILESTPHGISLIDSQGKYLYVNPYFTTITGYTLKDIPTKGDWFQRAYPDPEDQKRASEAWGNDNCRAFLGKSREFKIQCKNGQSKYIEFRSSFLRDLKISVLTDITDRKKSEEIIREKDRLQGVLELAGAVCHEMSQPLMGIQGYFEIISMDISREDPLRVKIEKIQTQIDRLSSITKKLMEISRYKTKDYLKEKIVDLAQASTRRNL